MSTVLFSGHSRAPGDDLRRALAGAGFAVADHLLGATPPVDFGPVAAAVIEAGHRADVALAQTRRWRVELGDHFVPVLWVLPEPSPDAAAQGLDAGADAVFARPVEPAVVVAQVRAMARAAAAAARVAVKADEARLLGEQLRKAYAQLDRELEMARRVHRTFLPRSLPEIGAARFAVCYRPRSRAGGDLYEVRRLDEHHVGFFLADVTGHGSAAGSLLGVFVKQSAVLKEIGQTGYRLVPPDEVLVRVNRDLLGLGLEDPPLVAMLDGVVNVRDGTLAVARAGLPPPVHVPIAGPLESWTIPGPFLGTADAGYQRLNTRLRPGDKLLVGTDGTRTDPAGAPDQLAEAASRHRALSGQAFVDAVAQEILPHVRNPDDFTLLCVEMVDRG